MNLFWIIAGMFMAMLSLRISSLDLQTLRCQRSFTSWILV